MIKLLAPKWLKFELGYFAEIPTDIGDYRVEILRHSRSWSYNIYEGGNLVNWDGGYTLAQAKQTGKIVLEILVNRIMIRL